MKKAVLITLVCMLVSAAFAGCGSQTEASQAVSVANPWSDWASIEEAETAAGFSFGLPEVIADSYTAVAFRTMNGELMEIIYRDADSEIRVRKQKGEGQDISGDYNQYDTCTEENIKGAAVICCCNSDNNSVKQLISYQGYSWSLAADNGNWGDSGWDFVSEILEQ